MSAKTSTSLEYDKDFYAWAFHNASLLREGKFSELDIENIVEEIESMGRRDKRELINRLAVLMRHLLKWEYQPNKRENSLKYTIKEQRFKLQQLLKESPSLNHAIELKIDESYKEAVILAATETGLKESTFPSICPFTLDQCLDLEFLPE